MTENRFQKVCRSSLSHRYLAHVQSHPQIKIAAVLLVTLMLIFASLPVGAFAGTPAENNAPASSPGISRLNVNANQTDGDQQTDAAGQQPSGSGQEPDPNVVSTSAGNQPSQDQTQSDGQTAQVQATEQSETSSENSSENTIAAPSDSASGKPPITHYNISPVIIL
jgi:hypothetical protein